MAKKYRLPYFPRVRLRRTLLVCVCCVSVYALLAPFSLFSSVVVNRELHPDVRNFTAGAMLPRNALTPDKSSVKVQDKSDTVLNKVSGEEEKTGHVAWCPDTPRVNKAETNFPLNLISSTHEALIKEFGKVMQHGGHYAPPTCRSREHLAIIITYRNREHNLYVLLHNLLPFLWRQMVEFTVFLAEQTPEFPFNKGTLFNAAYKEAQRLGNFTCFIMQDVDLVPMDNRNFYRCDKKPRHLCLTVGRTEWKNKLMYPLTFGGVVALRKEHMEIANGFSVTYYGWGLEDDDMGIRLTRKKLSPVRYPIPIGKYYALEHEKEKPNPAWIKLRSTIRQRQGTEGLNTLNYTLLLQEDRQFFTRLLIQVPPPPTTFYASNYTSA